MGIVNSFISITYKNPIPKTTKFRFERLFETGVIISELSQERLPNTLLSVKSGFPVLDLGQKSYGLKDS